LRSADPKLVRQEAWAHLAVHHCMTRIIMRLAGQERIDPDRISFVKGPQARAAQRHPSMRTDIRADQAVHGDDGCEGLPQARQRRQTFAEADRFLKRPASKYSFRKAGQVRRPARRVAAKVLTLRPAIVQ
jgi:hypothetical protein